MKRCNVCGFERARSFFTRRGLPNGSTMTLCKQCAETRDLHYDRNGNPKQKARQQS